MFGFRDRDFERAPLPSQLNYQNHNLEFDNVGPEGVAQLRGSRSSDNCFPAALFIPLGRATANRGQQSTLSRKPSAINFPGTLSGKKTPLSV